MKRVLYLIAIATAIFAFSACQKDELIEVVENVNKVTFTFTAEKVAETKTAAIQGESGASYIWTNEDVNNIHLIQTIGNQKVLVENIDVTKESDQKLTISAEVTEADTYTFQAVLANSLDSDLNPIIPATQSPNGINNYDPNADVLVSDVLTTSTPTNMLLKFDRKAVINKMTIKELPSGTRVSKVTISSSENLSGFFTGTYSIDSFTGSSDEITLNYNNQALDDNGQFPVYFVSIPNTGHTLTVKVFAGNKVYSKTFGNNLINLNLEKFTRFSVGSLTCKITDNIDLPFTGVEGNSYSYWSEKTSNSSAVYAGNSSSDHSSVQLRSNNSTSGIVSTQSGGKLDKIVVIWNENTTNGRTLDVYGSNTAYTSAANLYSAQNQGTLLGSIVCGTSTELEISGDYSYIGLRSHSGAMYLDEIAITWEATPGSGDETTVDTPAFSIDEGTYTSAQNVEITCATNGATIYYTLDGSTPDNTKAEYVSALTISETTTIKAIAIKDNVSSQIASATYTISQDAPITVSSSNLGNASTTPTVMDDQISYFCSEGNTYTDYLRIYANSTFTIKSKTKNIVKIVYTCASAEYANYLYDATFTVDNNASAYAIVDNNKVTVTITGPTKLVAATVSHQVRLNAISVTYQTNPGTGEGPKSVTYTVSSINSVSTTGIPPTGASASYSQTYTNNVGQMTKNNSITLTLSGYNGKKITSATVSVHSNAKAGSGNLSLKVGNTQIASITTSQFNSGNWNGSWSSDFVDKRLTVTETTVSPNDDIVLTINATANSLFFQSLTLIYE